MTDYARILRSYADARRMLRSDEARDAATEFEHLRAALRPFALYADQNDLTERDPRGAIEVPISDMLRALRVYGPNVHDDGEAEGNKNG